MRKPQFKDKKFENQELLDKWLNESSKWVITLEDKGFDILTIWIHESGEILHTDFHSSIYSGKFVDINFLNVGEPIRLLMDDNSDFKVMYGFIIEKIETYTKL